MALNNTDRQDADITQANYEQIMQPTNVEAVRPPAPQGQAPPAIIRAPAPLPPGVTSPPLTQPLPIANGWGR
jgi:hypothetical protein